MRRFPIRECLVGLAVLLSACVAIRLTRVAGGIALFWPSSAIGAALLIRFRDLRCGPALAAMTAALFLSNLLVAHRPWLTATSFVAINMCEIGLMVAAFRVVWVFPYPYISTAQATIMTVILGIAIPGFAAVIGGAMLTSHFSRVWQEGALEWSAILMIDLDRFKAVNDSGGHAAGDAVLRQVAQTCLAAVRASDTVARLGGDEFAIVLDNCPPLRAQSIAETILQRLNPLVVEWHGSRYEIGASLGLAMYEPRMATDSAWLSAADDACYAAKHQGRGCLKIAGAAAALVEHST